MAEESRCGLAGCLRLSLLGGHSQAFSQGSGHSWRLAQGMIRFQAHVRGCRQDSVPCRLLDWGLSALLAIGQWYSLSSLSLGPLHRAAHSTALASLICPSGIYSLFVTLSQNLQPTLSLEESHLIQPTLEKRELHNGMNIRQQWSLGTCHTSRWKTEKDIRKIFYSI